MNEKYKYIEVVKDKVTNRGTFIECTTNWNFDYYGIEKPIDSFHSAFIQTKDIITYIEEKGTTSKYDGQVRSEYLFWDIDNSDLNKALIETKYLIKKLTTVYKCNPSNIAIFFSGCKGWHVYYFCSELNNIYDGNDFNITIKDICSYIAKDIESFDSHIYNKTRIIRTTNSINSKTGLFKIPLSVSSFDYYDLDTILLLAKEQQNITFNPDISYSSQPLINLIQNIASKTYSEKKDSKISQTVLLEGIKHGFSKGRRNDGLTSIAGLLRSRNFSGDILYSFLTAINSNSPNPLPDGDIWNIANSVNKYSPNPLFVDPTHSDIITMKEAAEEWIKLRGKTGKLQSSFVHINKCTPFFDPGEVYMIAARSGIGKTGLGMQLSNSIAAGYNGIGLMASLEMPTTSVFVRSAVIGLNKERETPLEYEDAVNKILADRTIIDRTVDQWKHLCIINKSSLNIEQLQKYFELANEKYEFSVNNFFIDYIGLISGAEDYIGLSNIARGVKQIAKTLNTRVILVVQLSRKAGDGTIPVTIDMLRDSGAIEESADYINGMWLSKTDKNRIHCRMIKNRFAEKDQTFDIINHGLYYKTEDYVEDKININRGF